MLTFPRDRRDLLIVLKAENPETWSPRPGGEGRHHAGEERAPSRFPGASPRPLALPGDPRGEEGRRTRRAQPPAEARGRQVVGG